jgi:hypothetical protein
MNERTEGRREGRRSEEIDTPRMRKRQGKKERKEGRR